MQQNNNLSVLPFYKDINEQNHRKSYAFGHIYPLYVPIDRLLPFQIIRAHSENDDIKASTFHVLSGGTTSYMLPLTIKHYPELGYDVIIYEGTEDLSFLPLTNGRQYLEVKVGNETWYSDIFTIITDTTPYLKVEWYDEEDLITDDGIIAYEDTDFKNILYLCTELGKPDYTFEEEGESRDGYFFATKQISEKKYKFSFTATEYLCDVMRLIRMADHIKVTDKYGREYNCDTFLITPKWLEQGDLASVDVEFDTNTIAKKIGKGYANI